MDEALGHSLKAIELEPGNADAHHNTGLAYLLMGKPKDALTSVNRAIGSYPKGRYFFTLGKIHEALHDGPNALVSYRAFLERSGLGDPYRESALGRIRALEEQQQDKP